MQSALAATRGSVAAVAPRAAAAGRRSAANVVPVTRPSVRVSAASAEPATSGTDVEFTSAADLYKKFDELLDATTFAPQSGDKVTGTVSSIDRKGVYVELGAKSPAFCASNELSVARVERAADFISPGDAREFVVLREDQRSGELQLSIRRAEEALIWRRLRQSLEEGAAVEGLVTSFNAAGLMVDVQGQKGFVPGSHVPNNVSPEDLVGRRLSLKLLEVDEERQRLVLSNRRRASSSGGRTFRVGDVVVGTVAAVQVYGAFVDLGGGVNGLLHVSQISHDHVAAIDKVLAPGDKIKVLVLSHDRERGRISLSTKKLEPTPGDMLRNPLAVFERADEMAAQFRALMKEAEAAAREGEGGRSAAAAPADAAAAE